MAEDNGTAVQKWAGGTVLFAGGTDWSNIGRNIAGKKKGGADAVRARVKPSSLFFISKMQAQVVLSLQQAEEAIRAEKYPNLVSPRRLKALVVRPFSTPLHVL